MKFTDTKDMTPFEVHLIMTLNKIATALEKLVELDNDR